MHHGTRQIAPPGSPERGGHPEISGFWSKILRAPDVEGFKTAPVGDLEGAIRFAYAKMRSAEMRGHLSETIRGMYLDRIRLLEAARAQILRDGGGPPRDDSDVDRYLAGLVDDGEGDAD